MIIDNTLEKATEKSLYMFRWILFQINVRKKKVTIHDFMKETKQRNIPLCGCYICQYAKDNIEYIDKYSSMCPISGESLILCACKENKSCFFKKFDYLSEWEDTVNYCNDFLSMIVIESGYSAIY